MIDPNIRSQIELGAIRIAYTSLLMHVAQMSAGNAAERTKWLEDFKAKTLEGADGFSINIDAGAPVTEAEVRKLLRERVSEAVGGIKFSD